jgi:hypothetical protein
MVTDSCRLSSRARCGSKGAGSSARLPRSSPFWAAPSCHLFSSEAVPGPPHRTHVRPLCDVEQPLLQSQCSAQAASTSGLALPHQRLWLGGSGSALAAGCTAGCWLTCCCGGWAGGVAAAGGEACTIGSGVGYPTAGAGSRSTRGCCAVPRAAGCRASAAPRLWLPSVRGPASCSPSSAAPAGWCACRGPPPGAASAALLSPHIEVARSCSVNCGRSCAAASRVAALLAWCTSTSGGSAVAVSP